MRDLECSVWAPNWANSTEAVMMVAGYNNLYQHLLPKLGSSTSDIHYSGILKGTLGTSIRMVNKFYTANGLRRIRRGLMVMVMPWLRNAIRLIRK